MPQPRISGHAARRARLVARVHFSRDHFLHPEKQISMSDPIAPPSITREQAVRIASRLFACYLLFWVVNDIIALPHEVLTVFHELQGPSAIGFSALSAFKASYYARTSILTLAGNILEIALWAVAAGWFYCCGPRIYHFFTAGDE
jgi:hypothetical protein